MRSATIAIFACSLIGASIGVAEEPKYTVKTEKADPPKELKNGFPSLLSDQSIQVLDEKGGVVMTFWLRKAIPSKAAPEQVKNGLTYREIAQSTVVGVVQLAQPWTDYRKQSIAAGVYTLRFGLQPMNGDHQGTAPYNDFCLLAPAAKDEKPDTMDVKAMYELSSNASGGTHPAVMLLFPNAKPEEEPKLAAKSNNTVVLNVKMKVDANGTPATLGFAFTVAGVTDQ